MRVEFEIPIPYENGQITDFLDITIKEAYSQNPKIQYPMITVHEIDNSEAVEYSSNLGEEFSNVGYQINIYTRDIPSMQRTQIMRTLQDKVNNVLGQTLGMIRNGNPVVATVPSDSTILQCSIRYTGVLDIIRNILYKN